MLEEILAAISLGHKVVRTLAGLKKGVDALRSSPAPGFAHPSQVEELSGRTSVLEAAIEEQTARISQLEVGLREASDAAEALAQRVGVIFWISVAGCVFAVAAFILSLFALTHAIK